MVQQVSIRVLANNKFSLLLASGLRLDGVVLCPGFEGCLANFSINNEVQPFNGSGSILPDAVSLGKVSAGCEGPVGAGATAAPDPLSIGVTLVIVFFVILLVAILISFVPPLPPVPAAYDGFDSSFRGSLSTLVASDDDLSTHVAAPLYRPHNGSPASTAALGWDYLLNWGPNFESLVGVFKDIAELPDSVNGRVASSLRLPSSAPKPSEEYV
ncbi:Uncharacterized protein GBIM_07594 [Gryllus bimaculatus]|nr:Uncharacterized protein GBIM_07594 [Gryllus bimaculatus]